MDRRVVVTGLGLVTPIGIGVDESWQALLRGVSGAAPISLFDASEHATQFGCEVKNFDPTRWIEKRLSRTLDRFVQFAMVAAELAKVDAGLEFGEAEAERVGVYVGSGMGGLATIEANHKTLLERGPRKVSPYFVPAVIVNLAPGQIAIRWGAKGPNLSQVSACSTGAHAIGDAMVAIKRGIADVMVAGGSEATFSPLGLAGFNACKALSTRNDAPQRASRPFDAERDGFVMAEGAGVVILEELGRAKRRGARIYGEVCGYGLSSDAFHITQSSVDGAVRCMKMALAEAEVTPDKIDYINAHGTSTKINDKNETQAVKTVFGDAARSVAISSTKSMTGHMLGAAGGAETAFCLLALHHGVLPATINLDNPDPDCDLDYIPHQARERRIDWALSNSFGFGGTNASLVVKRYLGD